MLASSRKEDEKTHAQNIELEEKLNWRTEFENKEKAHNNIENVEPDLKENKDKFSLLLPNFLPVKTLKGSDSACIQLFYCPKILFCIVGNANLRFFQAQQFTFTWIRFMEVNITGHPVNVQYVETKK